MPVWDFAGEGGEFGSRGGPVEAEAAIHAHGHAAAGGGGKPLGGMEESGADHFHVRGRAIPAKADDGPLVPWRDAREDGTDGSGVQGQWHRRVLGAAAESSDPAAAEAKLPSRESSAVPDSPSRKLALTVSGD